MERPADSLTAGDSPLRLTSDEEDTLHKTRFWVKILYVSLLVALGLMAPVTIVVLIVAPLAPAIRVTIGLGLAMFSGFLLLYLGLLRRYIKGIEAHGRKEGGGLRMAFGALKGWWIYMAISALLSVTFTFIMILGDLLGITKGAGP